MTSLVSASQVVTGQVQSLDSVRAHALPSDAMIFASATKVQPANQNPGSYAIVESSGGVSGNPTINVVAAVTQSPFADLYKEGSMYFPGATSSNIYASLGSSYSITNGLTAECWVNYTSFAGSTFNLGSGGTSVYNPCALGAFSQSAGSCAWALGADTNGKLLFYYYSSSAGNQSANTNASLSLNTWNHIAVSIPSTGPISLYINGVQQTSNANNNGSLTAPSASTVALNGTTSSYNYLGVGGTVYYGGGLNAYTTGYIAAARVVYGAALYTGSSFTVPTAPLSPSATGTNALLLRAGQNSPTIQSGALTFDRGLKQYMNFGPQTFNVATRGFSIVFRYTWNGTATNNERILQAFPTAGSQASGIAITRNGTSSGLQFTYSLSGSYTFVNSATGLSQGTNYVAAFVYNASTGVAQWWINGVPSGTPGTGLTSSITTDYLCPWTLTGASFQYDSFGNFSSNTLAVYNRALSNVEILNAYSALTTATVNAPIEIGDVNGTPALSIAGDGRVAVTNLGQTSNVLPWPPAAMTGYDTVINGQVYKARASTETSSSTQAWYAFEKTTGSGWTSTGSLYSASSPYNYTGSVTTADVNGTVYPGEWLQIQLPTQIVVSSYSLGAAGGSGSGNPVKFTILGSRDGVNWTAVDSRSGTTTTPALYTIANPSVQSYSYFRVTIQQTSAYNAAVVGEWTLYGTADTAQTLTVAQPVTLSYGAQTASLTGISGDKYVPQDFSSSGLNIPAYVVSNTATVANTVQYSSFGPFAGEGSLYGGGGTGYGIRTPAAALDYNFGAMDYTFEAWVYIPDLSTDGTIFANGQVSFAVNSPGKVRVQMIGMTGAPYLSGTTSVATNGWYHVAATFTSATLRLFTNGVLTDTFTSVTGTPTYTSPQQLYIMSNSALGNQFKGYLSNFRITRGLALYTTSFTPPTGPLQPIQGVTQAGTPYGTVLLLRNAPAPGRVLTSKFGGANSGGVNGAPLTLAFPPAAMTRYATLLNSGYGQGTYVASASSENSGEVAWYAFDKSTSTFWRSPTSYTANAPYSGSVRTVDVNGTSYAGEWCQIQLPSSIVLSNYVIYGIGGNMPTVWYVLGSRDGTSWNLVDQRNFNSWSGYTTFTVSTSQAFTYYRFVFNTSNGATAALYDWTLNGTIEGPSVSADGRLGVGVSNPVQALEVAGSAVVAGTLSAGNPLMFRNRIINGDFRIDQRAGGASFTQTASGPNYGSADRWSVYGRLASKFSVQQSSVVPQGAGLSNSWLITSLSAYTTVTSDYYGIAQLIEGYNIADLMWGTSYGVPATVSFWIRSSVAGNYTFNVQGPSLTPSYSVQYAIGGTNSWQYVTITIPPPPSGTTFGALNTLRCRLWWDLGSSDTTYAVTTPGVWQSGDKVRVSGSVNLVATNGATMYITGVQLEKGTIATPFEVRPFATELALCQRYMFQLSPQDTAPCYQRTSVLGLYTIRFPVTMRTGVNPTIFGGFNVSLGSTDTTQTSLTTPGGAYQPSATGSQYNFPSAQTIGLAGNITINASGYIRYDAEL